MDRSAWLRVAAPGAVIGLIVVLQVASGPQQTFLTLVVIAPLLAASLLGLRLTVFYAVLALAVAALLGVVDELYAADAWMAQAVRLLGVAFGGLVAVLACRSRLEREARLEQARADAAGAHARARAAARMAGLVELARELGDSGSQTEVLEVVERCGLPLLGARGAALAATDPDGRRGATLVTPGLVDSAGPAAARAVPAGWLLAIAGTGDAAFFTDGAAARRRHSAAPAGSGAACLLPVRLDTVHCALWVSWEDPREFDAAESELLQAFAAQCAQALSRIRAQDREHAANSQVQRLAETLQRSLLTDPPDLDHLDIAVRYLPAAEHAKVGGDWYDAFVVPDGATMLVIGDVAGHDRSAAATMAQARGVLRGIAQTLVQPPATLLTALDGALHDLDVRTLATVIVAKIDHRRAERDSGPPVLVWSNAGHPPPLVIGADATARLLEREPDLLLGMHSATSRTTHEEPLKPGDTVVLYTDGLVEHRGSDIDEGMQWLLDTSVGLVGKPLDELCDALLARSHDRADDVALLAVRARP